MKHKGLYNFLGWIETIIMGLLLFSCIIVMVSVPTSGEWTLQFCLLKLLSMFIFYLVIKIEKLDEE